MDICMHVCMYVVFSTRTRAFLLSCCISETWQKYHHIFSQIYILFTTLCALKSFFAFFMKQVVPLHRHDIQEVPNLPLPLTNCQVSQFKPRLPSCVPFLFFVTFCQYFHFSLYVPCVIRSDVGPFVSEGEYFYLLPRCGSDPHVRRVQNMHAQGQSSGDVLYHTFLCWSLRQWRLKKFRFKNRCFS